MVTKRPMYRLGTLLLAALMFFALMPLQTAQASPGSWTLEKPLSITYELVDTPSMNALGRALERSDSVRLHTLVLFSNGGLDSYKGIEGISAALLAEAGNMAQLLQQTVDDAAATLAPLLSHDVSNTMAAGRDAILTVYARYAGVLHTVQDFVSAAQAYIVALMTNGWDITAKQNAMQDAENALVTQFTGLDFTGDMLALETAASGYLDLVDHYCRDYDDADRQLYREAMTAAVNDCALSYSVLAYVKRIYYDYYAALAENNPSIPLDTIENDLVSTVNRAVGGINAVCTQYDWTEIGQDTYALHTALSGSGRLQVTDMQGNVLSSGSRAAAGTRLQLHLQAEHGADLSGLSILSESGVAIRTLADREIYNMAEDGNEAAVFTFTMPRQNCTVAADFLSLTGSGTGSAPYEISSFADMQAIHSISRTHPGLLSAHYTVTGDIDCGGAYLDSLFDPGTAFTGTLNGGGHTVSNLLMGSSLIYEIGAGGTVQYLTLEDITGPMAPFAAANSGLIDTCSSAGNALTMLCFGIAVENRGVIRNCYNTARLAGSSTAGIASTNYGTIANCYNTGPIQLALSSDSNLLGYAGGITCWNEGVIKNSYNTAIPSPLWPTSRTYYVGGVTAVPGSGTIVGGYHRQMTNTYQQNVTPMTEATMKNNMLEDALNSALEPGYRAWARDGAVNSGYPIHTPFGGLYTLAVAADYGTVSLADNYGLPKGNTAEAGSNVYLTLRPDPGYHLTALKLLSETQTVLLEIPYTPEADGSALAQFLMPDANCMLAAVFTAKSTGGTYTVRFDSQGGSSVGNQSITSGGKVSEPTAPMRNRYQFTGWYTSPALTTRYDFDTAVTAPFTLYAGWREVDPAVYDHPAYISGYPNGTFRPGSAMTRAEAATLFYNLLGGETQSGKVARFSDVANGLWYSDAVMELARRGIINGYGDGSFRPNETITRAEFVTMVLRYAGINSSSGSPFPDVSAAHWAAGAVAAAVNAGYVNGYPDGTFRPEANLSRAEAVSFLNRVIQCGGVSGGTAFSDVPASHWAYAAITAAATGHDHE